MGDQTSSLYRLGMLVAHLFTSSSRLEQPGNYAGWLPARWHQQLERRKSVDRALFGRGKAGKVDGVEAQAEAFTARQQWTESDVKRARRAWEEAGE